MSVFYLKYRDTRPILTATLLKPDGTPQDLTGRTINLWIRLSIGAALAYSDERLSQPGTLGSGATVEKAMTISGAPTAGMVIYSWVDADWTGGSGLTVGGHRMEFEVKGVSPERLTFPNGGYDVLRVLSDIGQD